MREPSCVTWFERLATGKEPLVFKGLLLRWTNFATRWQRKRTSSLKASEDVLS